MESENSLKASEQGIAVGDMAWVWDEGPKTIDSFYSDKYGDLCRFADGGSARVEYTFLEPTDNYRHEFKSVIGLRIADIRSYTKEELGEEWDGQGWGCVIIMEDGTWIVPSQDDEGNGPGALFLGRRQREEEDKEE